MDQVERIAANNARKEADAAMLKVVQDIAAYWGCPKEWAPSAVPKFREVMVGAHWSGPEFTAEQIRDAYKRLYATYKYNTPPKVAALAELAREVLPPRPMQKMHNDPMPRDRWTPEVRAANTSKVDAMMAYIENQNRDRVYLAALSTHGKGSAQLKAVVERQTAEMQAWLNA